MRARPFIPTEEQTAAIAFAGCMVVTARPGSGKTAVVAAKIRAILPSLKRFQGVVAISYTNKASDELERRCRAEAVDTKCSFFGTIDEFCIKEIIRPFSSHVFDKRVELRTVKLNEVASHLTDMLPRKPLTETRIEDTRSLLPFLQACHAEGLIVLETVGLLSYFILNQSAACGRYIRARYTAVFVDEYQDSGYFQHCLFLALKGNGLCAVAVGDADQSIFLFAKKNPAYLISLTQPGSGFEAFALTVNHRSHPSITAYARRLLDASSPYIPDPACQVYQITVPGDQVAIAHWLRSNVVASVKNLGVPTFDRVGVLCATSHSAGLVAANIGIPHRLHHDGPFGQSLGEEAGLLHDLLRYSFDVRRNAQDIIQRYIHVGLTSVGERCVRAAIFQCRESGVGTLYERICRTAEMLLQRNIPSTVALRLQEICGSPDLLRWYLPPSADQIQILTLHKSKGLEFDLVYHLDLYDWILPRRLFVQGVWDPVYENEQQCLNLHYVGVTRAVKACVLVTSTQRINASGELRAGNPSQFLGRNGAAPQHLAYVPSSS